MSAQRRQPRRSSLSAGHPAEPLPAPAEAPSPAQEQAPQAKPVEQARKQPRRHRPKVSFYQDPEDTARVRGAILHTMAQEGVQTMSEFINNAVMAEVERLERKYNEGQPFPPLEAGGIPQGRPLGR